MDSHPLSASSAAGIAGPRLRLPPAPPRPRSARFPLAALLVPVLSSGALWLMTHSAYALVFAAAGPALAGLSVLEARRGTRRDRQSAREERAAALARIEHELAEAHAAEREELSARAPGATGSLNAPVAPRLWGSAGGPLLVSLGLGEQASGCRVEGEPVDEPERALVKRSRVLSAAPAIVDAAQGVAVCGPLVLREAYLRGLRVQLRARHPPHELARARLEGCERAYDISAGFAAIVELLGPATALLLSGGAVTADRPRRLAPELVPAAGARVFEQAMRERAAPRSVASAGAAAGGLGAVFARGSDGPVEIDLVADGPHAIVGGTTGSGKSELLVSWVAALAAERSPTELNVLLVDFKGGTAFRRLEALPHVVGVVTDLSPTEAERALRSLSAELRRREKTLAEARVGDVGELPSGALPRLVVVVDEFAALLDAHAGLEALFTDLAARGRALGIHLVLSTQRPAGTVRDNLAANCLLRLSLRVQTPADSRWLVGTDAASALPPSQPGRGVLVAGGTVSSVQFARTPAAEIEGISERWRGHAAGRRPWLAPLPPRVTRASLGASAGVALADVPDEQRRETVDIGAEKLPMAVLGVAGSGKSSVLRAIAAVRSGAAARLTAADDLEAAWDAVNAALRAIDGLSAAGAGLLLIDDADAIIARLGDEFAGHWLAGLARVFREGRRAGVDVVVTAQGVTPALRSVVAIASGTVLLRQASRQDHLLAGAAAVLYDPELPAGGAIWGGRRVQFVDPDELPAPPRAAAELVELDLSERRAAPLAIVTRVPARFAEAAARFVPPEAIVAPADYGHRDGGRSMPELVVGDSDSWLARPQLFAELRQRHPAVFYRCEPAEVRQLARARALVPPPLVPNPDRCWLLDADGAVARGRLGRRGAA